MDIEVNVIGAPYADEEETIVVGYPVVREADGCDYVLTSDTLFRVVIPTDTLEDRYEDDWYTHNAAWTSVPDEILSHIKEYV